MIDLDEVERTDKLQAEVLHFLDSPQFQTTLQIQSLCVVLHFSTYHLVGRPNTETYVKRVFPRWFHCIMASGCDRYLRDYREFISEWGHFMSCGSCTSPICLVQEYVGQIDRCHFGALSPGNFLQCRQERYKSFVLQEVEQKLDGKDRYEAVLPDGSKAHIICRIGTSYVSGIGHAILTVRY